MTPASERSPLISAADREHTHNEDVPTESSPLLANNNHGSTGEVNDSDARSRQASTWVLWPQFKASGSPIRSCRWPSIVAAIVLAIFIIAALVMGFVVPGAVKEYAEHAAIIEPTSLSVESITPNGIRARIIANFRLDGSRVEDANSRRIGRLATGIMKKLETDHTTVNVYLPGYDNALLGSAVIPGLTVDIVDGHNTSIDIVTDLTPGDAENIRRIANDWLEGRLDELKVMGTAAISLKSGIFPLGTHDIAESMVFEATNIPSLPDYKIESLNFHDIPLGRGGRKAVGSNVTLSVYNEYPIGLDVPPLGFDILVANCDSSDSFITVAEAVTDIIEVRPNTTVTAAAFGVISEIPKALIRVCPKTNLSPLDHFMEHYLHGEIAKVWVRGKTIDDSDTPDWISSILESIVVPVDLPGRSFGDAIRNFSVADVDFKLPSPFADPNDPEAAPRVSGNILVLAALPEELDLDIGVNGIKSNADLFYKGKKMGELNLHKWQKASSTKLIVHDEALIQITTRVVDVPLNITDQDVFSDVLQKMLFGDGDLILDVIAAVDVQVGTVLGDIAVKGVPAKGKIPVKSLPKDTLSGLLPKVDDIQILNTSDTGVSMMAKVNFTNPTPYTATIPWFNAHIYSNGSIIGEVVAKDATLQLGNNTGTVIHATWDPVRFGGEKAHQISRKLLSDYLSGKNTTLGFKTHRGSFPTMPLLGEAFSKLNFTIPTPRLKLPGGDDGEPGQSYIKEATFHIISSTASFKLASPLQHNTVYIDHINATAYYNHTEPIGQIISDEPFSAPPGLSQTPRLPVEWSPSRVGYGKLKEALGGKLKLDAVADVTIRMGNWAEKVRYEGKGIGAKVAI